MIAYRRRSLICEVSEHTSSDVPTAEVKGIFMIAKWCGVERVKTHPGRATRAPSNPSKRCVVPNTTHPSTDKIRTSLTYRTVMPKHKTAPAMSTAAAVLPRRLLSLCSTVPRTHTLLHHGRLIHSTSNKPPTPSELLEEPPRNLQDVQFTLEGGVATIALDRYVFSGMFKSHRALSLNGCTTLSHTHTHSPHRLNALSEPMAESLLRLSGYLAAAPADQVRVCVVTGGPRAFSTGRDLKVRPFRLTHTLPSPTPIHSPVKQQHDRTPSCT